MSAHGHTSVLWREGMFLFPQHLQAFARELQAQLHAAGSLGLVGDWGLLELDVDDEALVSDTFGVRRAVVLFRDGSLAFFPGSASVEPREFAEHFRGPELDVYLGVPAVQNGVPQIGAENGRMHRYRVLRAEVGDENERDARRELEFRQLQGRLFFGEEDRSGFESVPIARLGRVGEPRTRSVLAPAFIPPVLRCGASTVLSKALKDLATMARGQARDLAARMPDVSRMSSVEKGSDILGLFKLQAVNQCVSLLDQAAGQDALHPFHAYEALVRSAGNLAVFGPGRVSADLRPYEHGDLDACFREAIDTVRALLEAEVAAPYDSSSFVADGVRPGLYRCELPAEWVDRHGIFHLAVEMAEEADTVREMVAAGIKLLPEKDIERVLQGVTPGIQVRHERVPPLSFPKRESLHYFAIETEGPARDSWLKILKSRGAVILSAMGDEVSFHFYVEFPE